MLEFGLWRRTSGFESLKRLADRQELYAQAHDMVAAAGKPIDYLEFGVWRGESINSWASLNRNPASRFVGFDSFCGLPQEWTQLGRRFPKGAFSTGGRCPVPPDPRVRFVQGLFHVSLGPFLRTWQPRHRLVVHLDADLYSATLFVLCSLHEHLQPGTLVVFDEFACVMDEFRALTDYTHAFSRTMRPIARAGRYDMQVCFEVVR
jgi:hypothetical protein